MSYNRSLLEKRLIEAAQQFTKDPFGAFDRFSVGYENILGDLREAGAQDLHFPFHNLEKVEDGYLLHFTVAGWSREEIRVEAEENKIVITGEPFVTEGGEQLYVGITKKPFERTIIVSRDLEVRTAWMENGLLSIKFVKPEPVSNVKQIPIVDGTPLAKAEAAKADYLRTEKARHDTAMGKVPEGSELLNEGK